MTAELETISVNGTTQLRQQMLNEIIDIVHRFGYTSFGDEEASTGVQRKLPVQSDGAPLTIRQHLADADAVPKAFPLA